jgi:hypothetical protein
MVAHILCKMPLIGKHLIATLLRGVSHYGWRSRGRRFPPTKLQETKSSASRLFTLSPKAVTINLECSPFGEGDGLSKEVWVGWEWSKNQSLARSWALDWRGCFEIKGMIWDVPLDLDFGLGLWRLHTITNWRLHLLYIFGYFQPISLDFQQSLATQSHGLSTWTSLVWSGPKTSSSWIHQ